MKGTLIDLNRPCSVVVGHHATFYFANPSAKIFESEQVTTTKVVKALCCSFFTETVAYVGVFK